MTRPFYHSYADAYDLLITDPVEPWVEAVHERMGGVPGRILDAGCGTGRHAAALIARGHQVDLVDRSAELLEQAMRRCPGARAALVDICDLSPLVLSSAVVAGQAGDAATGKAAAEKSTGYDAVTCRGVLNDMIPDASRAAAIAALAGCLRPGGALFLDVRDAATTVARSHNRTVEGLTYTSHATWDTHLLHVEERFDDGPVYHFTMRPWTIAELESLLRANGLRDISIGAGAGRRTQDRLFVVAR